MMRSFLYFVFSCYCIAGLHAQPQPSSPSASSLKDSQSGQPALLDETLNLARGHQEFKDLYFKQHEQEFVRLVKEGQSPKILFIGCSDSRVVPDLILNTRPGQLFVIRTAGNFVTPYNFQSVDGVAATLQYAIEVLNIPHIVVCGHSHCGAIEGLFQELPEQFGILQRWLKLGERAKKMTLLTAKPSTPKEELYATAEEINVIVQLDHLMSFPFVRKRIEEGKLEIHGWYFKIETGQLWYYNTEQYKFIPLIDNKSTMTR